MTSAPFWKTKSMHEMSAAEWESLCDGCGKCCQLKVEDEDTGEIGLTTVVCKLLDLTDCRCSDYANRFDHVPDCIRLTPDTLRQYTWLPRTCGYRLVAEGKDLHWWHPLVSGSADTVHTAGISVKGRVFSESEVGDPEDFVAQWLNAGGDPFAEE